MLNSAKSLNKVGLPLCLTDFIKLDNFDYEISWLIFCLSNYWLDPRPMHPVMKLVDTAIWGTKSCAGRFPNIAIPVKSDTMWCPLDSVQLPYKWLNYGL